MRQFSVLWILGWEERQGDFSEIAATVNHIKVTSFEHDSAQLENRIKKKARLADIFSGMELSREKETCKHPHRGADLFLWLPHLNPHSLKEKKTRDLFCCCLLSGDNGDTISSVNNNVSEGEAQTGGSDNMQLKEESPYLFLCRLKCHLSFLPPVLNIYFTISLE